VEQQLHLVEDVLLGGEGHLQVDLVELARATVAREASSLKHGAIWK